MGLLDEKIKAAQIQKAIEARKGRKFNMRWSCPREARRSLARVNNMLLNGEVTVDEANALIASANLILRALEMDKGNGE